jgi:hypothetical protein
MLKAISGTHELAPLNVPHIDHGPKLIRVTIVSLIGSMVASAQKEHFGVAHLQSDVDPLSDIEALSEDSEPVESEVDIQLRHAVSEAMHEPSRAARWETVRFEAERGELNAAILPALFVISVVGDGSLDLAESDVGDTAGANDCDVVGDGSGADEVVSDDVTRSSVVAGN